MTANETPFSGTREGPRVRPTVRRRPGAASYGLRERLRPAELTPLQGLVASRVFRVTVTPDGRVHLGLVTLRARVFGVERRGVELWLFPERADLPLLRIRGDGRGLRIWLTGAARVPAYELGLRAFGAACEVIVEVRVDGVIVLCARTPARLRRSR